MTSTSHVTWYNFHKDFEKRLRVIDKNHQDEPFGRGSRWPFTDRLTSDEIIVTRDTFIGHRKTPTKLTSKTPYERQVATQGWDPLIKHDNWSHTQTFGTSAREEEHLRAVPITANAIYGKRLHHSYDFLTKLKPREFVTKRFLNRNGALPPLRHYHQGR